ncbi:helix-turn-helix domain-containing protein [Streptomyces hilarionis]|uniref:helix-turn-helix domain-containing protein n=1 Tax=Streptomyces hilarionis TaxID=2839954 RepID=UPI00211A7418|nr:helix-turn-helix transcriptional regulator [Streptomyces hilarionis]MCQ9136385.1 helix-turn-helix transcriptional regulator [Streptomyces hilarionis]
MRWELRERAAERGMRTSAEVRRRLAGQGLVISAGKMSGWWSGIPVSVRLDDLEALCAVLACEPSDLLIRAAASPDALPCPAGPAPAPAPGVAAQRPGRLRRSVPPL